MHRAHIPVEELEPRYGEDYHSPGLVRRIREIGWRGIPPIPVVEIPEDLRAGKKRYSFVDGHHRYNAAIVTGADSLDCVVYCEDDDVRKVSERTGRGVLINCPTYISILRSKRNFSQELRSSEQKK